MDKPIGSLISYFANKVKAHGGINLAQGIPGFEPPKALLEHLQQIAKKTVHQYAPGIGNHKLLQHLSDFYQKPTENFLLVNGATEAISLLFIYLKEKLEPGFSVLGFDPVYETYRNLPRIFNVPFLAFKMDNNLQPDFLKLEKQIQKHQVKIIMLATPGNPLGKVWTKAELLKLVSICNTNKVYLIIDAVYADLYFDEKPFYPISELHPRVFYVNSFSKKFSITGWRIGYLMAHQSHLPKIMDIHDYTGLCAPSILQEALVTYINKNNAGADYICNLRQKLKINYTRLATAFVKMGFDVVVAHGGYFVWAKLPQGYNSGFDFALRLYESKKVAVVPGIHFSEHAENYIRLNIARNENEIQQAIKKVGEFITENI